MRSETRTAPPAHRTAVLAIILVSYLVIVLDISNVITALPKIECGLSFSATGLSWVQNACTLALVLVLIVRPGAGAVGGDAALAPAPATPRPDLGDVTTQGTRDHAA
jgi:hypothetical protein